VKIILIITIGGRKENARVEKKKGNPLSRQRKAGTPSRVNSIKAHIIGTMGSGLESGNLAPKKKPTGKKKKNIDEVRSNRRCGGASPGSSPRKNLRDRMNRCHLCELFGERRKKMGTIFGNKTFEASQRKGEKTVAERRVSAFSPGRFPSRRVREAPLPNGEGGAFGCEGASPQERFIRREVSQAETITSLNNTTGESI